MKRVIASCLLGMLLLFGIQSPALAFKVPIHEAITREVFANFEVMAGGERLKFTDYAIDQIVKANKDTDDLPNQFNSEKHFDGENFVGGSQRVKDLKERTIAKVTTDNPTQPTSARNDLGTALHTVQDFYAHSNWVELGHSSPNIKTEMGREVFSGAAKETPTCPNAPGTLGGAGLTELTSGYFLLENQVACGVPTGKCRHGVPIVCSSGLNKDDDSRPGFSKARSLAVDATLDLLNQIFEDSRMQNNVYGIKSLMRIPI
ncbi:HET-C-related protein [Microseira sp. BLCC-F43]|uniref:HET-C-related protein n=1 Tax=Microseira sp. BLCC-F43 TaxID=3153602 RepID=UPI0035B6E801